MVIKETQDTIYFPVPSKPTVSVDVKQHFNHLFYRAQELCQNQSRWPSWAPVPNKPTVSVDIKQHSANHLFEWSATNVRLFEYQRETVRSLAVLLLLLFSQT